MQSYSDTFRNPLPKFYSVQLESKRCQKSTLPPLASTATYFRYCPTLSTVASPLSPPPLLFYCCFRQQCLAIISQEGRKWRNKQRHPRRRSHHHALKFSSGNRERMAAAAAFSRSQQQQRASLRLYDFQTLFSGVPCILKGFAMGFFIRAAVEFGFTSD